MKGGSTVVAAFTPEATLKRKIRAHLRKLGFHKGPGGTLVPPSTSKESVRALHYEQRRAGLKQQREFVQRVLPELQQYFAEGSEVDPSRVEPVLELIKADSWQSNLFRLASLSWSVPVSAGYGRRLRYLVWDKSNGKLLWEADLGDRSNATPITYQTRSGKQFVVIAAGGGVTSTLTACTRSAACSRCFMASSRLDFVR